MSEVFSDEVSDVRVSRMDLRLPKKIARDEHGRSWG